MSPRVGTAYLQVKEQESPEHSRRELCSVSAVTPQSASVGGQPLRARRQRAGWMAEEEFAVSKFHQNLCNGYSKIRAGSSRETLLFTHMQKK